MPLSGDRKRDYQREYMRRRRSNKDPLLDPLLDPKQQKLAQLRQLINEHENADIRIPMTIGTLTIYNPSIHKPGDKVLIRRGKKLLEYVVPDLDVAGQPMPDYW